MLQKKVIIGLTGPIASGKNEAAEIFKKHGALIIDADKIGHVVLNKEKEKIKEVFGKDIILRNGSVDRKKLANLVFKKSACLAKLNKLAHPKILNNIKSIINSSHYKIIVINAAVLKNIGLIKIADFVITILAKKSLRISRLVNKSLTMKEACLRINAQMPDRGYKQIADYIIYNNSSLKSLEDNILRVYALIRTKALK